MSVTTYGDVDNPQAARAQAIRWLGDRYLLAKPLNGNHGTGCNVPLTRAQLALMGFPASTRMTRVDHRSSIDIPFGTETLSDASAGARP